MKIAHLADIHQGLGYPGPFPLSRFDDINKILDVTADRIIAEEVQLCLVAGDLFKDAKVMFDRGTEETICIGNWLRKLSGAGINVIIISGTPSHDSLAGYKFIEQMQIPNVSIYTKPTFTYFSGLNIACLPGLNRSALMTQDEYKGLPAEQVHRIMTDKITQLCQGMAAQMPDDKPKILMAHMTYQGAETGFTDLLMQQEPLLSREATQGFDLVCLGHIHRPQRIGNVFYSGPIERLSFNEENIEPGFWIFNLDGHIPDPVFIKTPSRKYITWNWTERDVELFINSSIAHGPRIDESIIRLHYTCSEETNKKLNRKALGKALYERNAFFVSEIKGEVQREDRSRDVTVNESLTPLAALDKWAVNQGIGLGERSELLAMTQELLEG